MYKTKRNYENLNKWNFLSDGTYGIPDIEPINADNCDFIGFNYANTCNNPEECKGNIVHIKSFSDKWNKAEVSQW